MKIEKGTAFSEESAVPLGRTDLERKASFATEGVQGYDESSANGGRTKTLIKTRKTKGFQP